MSDTNTALSAHAIEPNRIERQKITQAVAATIAEKMKTQDQKNKPSITQRIKRLLNR